MVLFVTHNAELALRCDRTIQVINGRVIDTDMRTSK